MVLEILCVEPIYPQYSGVLETCFGTEVLFLEVLGSESVKLLKLLILKHNSSRLFEVLLKCICILTEQLYRRAYLDT